MLGSERGHELESATDSALQDLFDLWHSYSPIKNLSYGRGLTELDD